MNNSAIDFDNPWKEALFFRFEAFMSFFFPNAHAAIKWSRKPVFLESELRVISKKAKTGMRRADALVKVYLKDGREQWVLIHIEIQSQRDPKFAERMYVYNYRIFERYKRHAASLAILADQNADWRPIEYHHEVLGTKVSLQDATAKLMDLAMDLDDLKADANPFAFLVLAHMKTQETHRDPDARLTWKLSLIKLLLRCLSKAEIREMMRLVDWLMVLPDNLQARYEIKLKKIEESKTMPYVTSFEKWGRRDGIVIGEKRGLKKGRIEGLEKGLEKGQLIEARKRVCKLLDLRFGKISTELKQSINRISAMDKLDELFTLAAKANSLEEFKL